MTKAVANAVVEAMEERGKSQLALSEATGIPRTTLLRRLAGLSPFTVSELEAIAGYLGVSASDLVQRAEAGAA